MQLVRVTAIAFVLLIALVVGAPLQVLLARIRPRLAAVLPRLLCGALLGLLGVRLVCRSAPRTGLARLVVANHVSWLDILALGSLEPLSFLAKVQVMRWPVFGALARVNATVFIDRARRRSIPGVNRAMAARLIAGRSVVLFPEGTTYDGSCRGRFLTSHLACLAEVAALGGEPGLVQAVAISYSHPDAAWVGDATLLPHIWAVLRRPGLVCRLAYGDMRHAKPGCDRKLLGRMLAAEVEALLTDTPPDSCSLPTADQSAGSR